MTELEGMEIGEHRTKIATAILCGSASDEDVKELALDVLAHPWPAVDRTPRVTGNPLFARLPERFQWTAHNLISHPLSEILFQIGLEDWSNRIHDWTIPAHETGTGRG